MQHVLNTFYRKCKNTRLGIFVCVCVCVFVCQSACPSVCISICLLTCLLACLYAGLLVCLSVCLSVFLAGWLVGWLAGCLSRANTFIVHPKSCVWKLENEMLRCDSIVRLFRAKRDPPHQNNKLGRTLAFCYFSKVKIAFRVVREIKVALRLFANVASAWCSTLKVAQKHCIFSVSSCSYYSMRIFNR